MSAKVDIATDQGRSLFANSGCRSSSAIIQGDRRSPSVSLDQRLSVNAPDDAEWEKSPIAPETQKQVYPKRHYSFSGDEKLTAGKQRRYSDKLPGGGAVALSSRRRGGRMGRYYPAERLRERIVLPTRFLLGGNITDPLNLNSLCDDEVNRSMNQTTPISSPVPIPVHRMEVKVLVPANSADPLNLNAEDGDNSSDVKAKSFTKSSVFRKRRKRNRRKKRNIVPEVQQQSSEQVNLESTHPKLDIDVEFDKSTDDTVAESSARHRRVIDHIVSPVIPQKTSKWSKRRRTASESRAETVAEYKLRETADGLRVETKARIRHKSRQLSGHLVGPHFPLRFRANDRKFSHGNYSGNGTILGDCKDDRLAYFSKEMFSGKDVLDIGCGVGHVLLCIGRDFGAHRVVGLDINPKVVETALKNKLHFASAMLPDVARFPVSVRQRLGPLVAPQLLSSDKFPHNVAFLLADYVPRSEEQVQQQSEEYDVILGLRITKWIHLNYGDVGLKQSFRRMYKQLRPGGSLVLEMQPWKSCRKKKKLTERIFQTYRSIEFHPDMFADYLMSREVGFTSCERLQSQSQQCIALKQPLYAFKKPLHNASASSILHPLSANQSLASVRSTTLSMAAMCSAHGTPDRTSSCCWLTPKFEVGSTSCSTTPCSTPRCQNTPNAADDGTNVASPCSSASSSSSSSSSSSGSRDRLQTSLTENGSAPACVETSSIADVQLCTECGRLRTSVDGVTVSSSDDPLPSMHPDTAYRTCPMHVTADTERLHTPSPS